jgi:hypothetical protein
MGAGLFNAKYVHRDAAGHFHCGSGPAIEWTYGDIEWWVHGERCTSFNDFQRWTGKSDMDMSVIYLKYGTIFDQSYYWNPLNREFMSGVRNKLTYEVSFDDIDYWN